jgi:hypothetical protein
MAATNSLAFDEQNLRPNPRGVRDRLRSLWDRSLGARVLQNKQSEAAPLPLDQAIESTEKPILNISAHEGFQVEARTTSGGWRVASIDQSSGVRHEFYVQGGGIFHVDLWGHSGEYIVGRRVERISNAERQAVLRAVGAVRA